MEIKINPKIKFYEAEYYLEDSLNPRLIKNTEIYNLVKELTSKFYPSYKDDYERRWEDFYLPFLMLEKSYLKRQKIYWPY